MSFTARPRPIYGRADEFLIIDGFLAQVRRSGGAMVLYGRPGSGTTALLEMARNRARSAGIRVVEGSGGAFGPARRFSGLAQVVEQLAADEPSAQVATVRTLLGRRACAQPDALVYGVSVLLRRAARRSPLLLALDDGIEADPADLSVWSQILARIQGRAGLGLLGVVWPEHRKRLSGVSWHEVPPLTDIAARQLLASRHPELPRRFVDRVLIEAAGNPLALEELPEQWQYRRPADEPRSPVPNLGERARSSYQRRFATFTQPTRDLLLLMAVGGSAPLPAQLTDDRVAAAQPALEAQLVVAGPDDRLVLAHPMIRTALLDLATEQQRNRAHLVWADALTSADPERSIFHRAAAAIHPDETLARALHVQSVRAWQRGHERSALATARAAARLSPDPDGRSRRLVDAAYAGVVSGRIGAAQRLLADAREADPRVTGSLTESTAAAFMLLAGDGDAESAHRLLSAAIDAYPDRGDRQDPDLVHAVHALSSISSMALRTDLWDDCRRILERLQPPRSAAIRLAQMVAEIGSGRAPVDLGPLEAGLAEANTQASPTELVWFSTSAVLVQRSEELAPALEAVLPTVPGGIDGTRTQLEFHLAYVRLLAGRWDEALVVVQAGLDALSVPRQGLASWALTGVDALIAAHRGDTIRATALAHEVMSWATPRKIGAAQNLVGRVRGAVAMAQGEYEEAFRHLTMISPIGASVQHLAASLQTTLDLVQAAVRTDRRQLAELYVEALQDAQIARCSAYQSMLVDAAAALAAGSDARASALFQQALRPAEIERWPFETARIRLAYGEHLRRLGAVIRSREQLSEAREIFALLGAEPWTRRTIAELRATGDGDGLFLEKAVARLSPQEQHVAQLAASGLTNKQIGEKLFLSPRTVGNHLHRAFPKLGVTTRAGLRDALSQSSEITSQSSRI